MREQHRDGDQQLLDMNYTVQPELLKISDYDVPQLRRRFFCIAVDSKQNRLSVDPSLRASRYAMPLGGRIKTPAPELAKFMLDATNHMVLQSLEARQTMPYISYVRDLVRD